MESVVKIEGVMPGEAVEHKFKIFNDKKEWPESTVLSMISSNAPEEVESVEVG